MEYTLVEAELPNRLSPARRPERPGRNNAMKIQAFVFNWVDHAQNAACSSNNWAAYAT